MRNHAIIVIAGLFTIFMGLNPIKAQDSKKPVVGYVEGRNAAYRFSLRVVSGPLRHTHRLTTRQVPIQKQKGVLTRTHKMYYVDGEPEWNGKGEKNWFGTDDGFPDWEIYSMNLTVNGRRWLIPVRLYADCYQASHRSIKQTWLSKDGEHLTVKMRASDGGGTYGVLWTLRRGGKHSRVVTFGT